MPANESFEDFVDTISYIRHQARAIVVSLKLFEESIEQAGTLDTNGVPLYRLIAEGVRDKSLEIAVWAAALGNEKID